MEHSNLFHAALIKVQDIAKNGTRNTAAWLEVMDTASDALAKARFLDEQAGARQRDKIAYDHT
jgi:hypothetical protein